MMNKLQKAQCAIRKNERALNYKLLIGGLFLFLSFATTLKTGFTPTLLAIELAATFSAIWMALLCFRHVYLEHVAYSTAERQAKTALLYQIMENYPANPGFLALERGLQETLEYELTPQERLTTLEKYQQDPSAITHLAEHLLKQHTKHSSTLQSDGSWHHPKNSDRYHLSA